MKRTRPVHVLAALAVLAAIGVATASAAATKERVDVPGHEYVPVRTDCPRGSGLVSQGFGTKDFSIMGTGSTVARIDSHRSGSGLASGAFNFGPQQGVFDVYAYCSKVGRDIDVVRDKTSVLEGTAGVAKAVCPRGSAPIGGGFGSPGFANGGGGVIALTSRLQGRGWRVEGVGQGGPTARGGSASSGTLASFAYCMKDAPKLKTRKRSATVGQPPLTPIVATCPKGSEAVSGGFNGRIDLSTGLRASAVLTSRRAKHGRAWKGGAISVGEATSARATVFAYCMKRS